MKKVVEKRKDIAFYIKMFPLVSIHPEAYKKAKAIVCEKSDEKSLKMLEDAFDGLPLPEPACQTDVLEMNMELAAGLGISGTPTIVFPSGKKVAGVPSAEEIEKIIDSPDQP